VADLLLFPRFHGSADDGLTGHRPMRPPIKCAGEAAGWFQR
jgi:hypothetical protein